jgi:pimeloyl-ACP methyl ester carboxylesterase
VTSNRRPHSGRHRRTPRHRVWRHHEPTVRIAQLPLHRAAHTLAAAERLSSFDRPALIVWGMRDAFFPARDAERLAELFPDARLERIGNARTFVQLDAPERLAELVAEMLPAGVSAGS